MGTVRTLDELVLSLLVHSCDEGRNLWVRLELRDGLRIGPDRLHEADGVRVDTLGVLGEVAQCVRDLIAEPQEVPDLLEERNDLRVKVNDELEVAVLLATLGDAEQASADLEVAPVDVGEPSLVDRTRVELLAEGLALGLEPLAFGVMRPFFAEDVFDSLHVVVELPFDLLRPRDRAGDGRLVAKLRHRVRLGRLEPELELVLQRADVVLDRVDELRLVLGDRAANLWADKERVELGKDAKHLVRVFGASETVAQARDDVVLDARHALVVGGLGRDPVIGSLCARE